MEPVCQLGDVEELHLESERGRPTSLKGRDLNTNNNNNQQPERRQRVGEGGQPGCRCHPHNAVTTQRCHPHNVPPISGSSSGPAYPVSPPVSQPVSQPRRCSTGQSRSTQSPLCPLPKASPQGWGRETTRSQGMRGKGEGPGQSSGLTRH